MKSSSMQDKGQLPERIRQRIALAAAVHRPSIEREPLIQIGLSTGLLKRSFFNAAGRAYDIASGRATLSSVLADTQSLIEDQYKNGLRHYESSNSDKELYYSNLEPASCRTGERPFWMY